MLKGIIFIISSFLIIGCGNSGNIEESFDDRPPIITLNGEQDMFLKLGDKYVEPGATVTDDKDKDLKIKIEGSVNENVEDTYIIKYSVVDSSGNEAKEERMVTVTEDRTSGKTEIEILALYSDKANQNKDAETKIIHNLFVANKVNNDSGVNIYYKLVKAEQYQMNETQESEEFLIEFSQNQDVIKKRNEAKADLVLVYRTYANDNLCGIGFFSMDLNEKYGFSNIAIDCDEYTTAHELGHNLGLGHSHIQKQEGVFPYSVGYGVDKKFSTIMAYSESFHTEQKAYIYSNPNKDCFGESCGIEEGESGQADATKSLNITKDKVEKFR